jgi:hypothetical protein
MLDGDRLVAANPPPDNARDYLQSVIELSSATIGAAAVGTS